MLRLADDDLRDTHSSGCLQRVPEQRVRVLSALLRRQVIRGFEVAIVDLVGVDKIHDADRLVLVEGRRFQILLGQDDKLPSLVFEALDEIFPGNRLAFPLADAFIPHRRFVARVQHPELRPMIAHGSVQFHGNRDETKRNRAFPDCARHGTSP